MTTTVAITKRIDDISSNSSHSVPHKTHIKERVVLPMPPALADLGAGQDTRFEMEVYARFMRHLRDVPNSRMEIKILSAIQFTADMLDLADALVAKTLVDLGLLAPRKAFPVSFLEFCDKCLMRKSWGGSGAAGGPSPAVEMLKAHWDRTGEDRFGALPVHYEVFNERVFLN